jgi:hypothetical protein
MFTYSIYSIYSMGIVDYKPGQMSSTFLGLFLLPGGLGDRLALCCGVRSFGFP